MDEFITVKTFTYPHELAVVRGKLESEGIDCVVQDEMTVQANPLYSNALGGIKLKVKTADFERATEILREAHYETDDETEPQPITKMLDDAEEKIAAFDWRKMSLPKATLILAIIVLLISLAYYFLN